LPGLRCDEWTVWSHLATADAVRSKQGDSEQLGWVRRVARAHAADGTHANQVRRLAGDAVCGPGVSVRWPQLPDGGVAGRRTVGFRPRGIVCEVAVPPLIKRGSADETFVVLVMNDRAAGPGTARVVTEQGQKAPCFSGGMNGPIIAGFLPVIQNRDVWNSRRDGRPSSTN